MNRRKAAGFGLIEILVAVVVLGVGLISLAKLESVLLSSGNAAKARANAAALAEEKMEELRSYTVIETTAGQLAYADILPNAGGNLTAATHERGGVNYTLVWTVTDSAGTVLTAATASRSPKLVRVTVTWTQGEKGQLTDESAQQYQLTALLTATSPAGTADAVTSRKPHDHPVVAYTPGSAPQHVAIEVDGQRFKETRQPDPTILQQGAFATVGLDEVTFKSTDGGGYQTMEREEYYAVNCLCDWSSSTDAYDPWVPSLERAWKTSERHTKRAGVKATGVGTQPALCDMCCRDHHDRSGATAKYDPFRGIDNYPQTGDPVDHSHYNLDVNLYRANNDVADTTFTGNPSQTANFVSRYYEACRFRRINGLLQATPDWNLAAFNVIPQSWLEANMSAYQIYVVDFVLAYANWFTDATNDFNYQNNGALPDPACLKSQLVVPQSCTPTVTLAGKLTEKELSAGAPPYPMLARGIYVDYMDAATRTELRTIIADTELSASEKRLKILQTVPFHEVNLTKLARWSSTIVSTSGGGNVSVADEPMEDHGTQSRGVVTMSAAGNVEAKVSAKIGLSNTGFTNTTAIDPHDRYNIVQDRVAISTPAEGTIIGPVIKGTLGTKNKAGEYQPSSVLRVFYVNASTNAEVACYSGTSTDLNYRCDLPPNTNTATLRVKNYNENAAPQGADIKVCINAPVNFIATRTLLGSGMASEYEQLVTNNTLANGANYSINLEFARALPTPAENCSNGYN